MLLAARDEEAGEALIYLQARNQRVTIIVAGHKITAAALVRTLWLLGHVDAERLRAVLATVRSSSRGEPAAGRVERARR